jgi:putative flippase GtrA
MIRSLTLAHASSLAACRAPLGYRGAYLGVIGMTVTLRGVVDAVARHSMVRFAVVGGIGFGTDVFLLWLLHGVAHLWLWLATALAYLVAFAIGFVLSREWVFPESGRSRRQIYRYCWLVAGVLLLTVVGVQALAWLGVPYLIAKVVTSGVVAVVNYVSSRWWVFRVAPAVARPEPEPEPVSVA